MIVVSTEVIAVLALLPAMPVIVYSERRGMRSFGFHTGAGALIGTVGYLLFAGIDGFSFAFPGWGIWLLTAFSGFCGALGYWLIAGRSAGIERTRATLQAMS